MYYQNYTPTPQKRGIDNIFSALVHEKTPGAIMEFSLWCTVCVVVFMSLIAAIVGDGNIAWLMLMLFAAGMAVLMAFRLKPILLLYGAVVMNFFMFLIHFLCFTLKDYSGRSSFSALNLVLFILLIITSIVLTVFAFVHFFSRYNFGNTIAIMVMVHSGLSMLLHILLFACHFMGDGAEYNNETVRDILNARGYWVGTISYWAMLIVICLFYGFFFWGFIDSRKGKIINTTGAPRVSGGFIPAIKGLSGTYAGQVIQISGRELTIGSKQCHIILADPYVSGKHCVIRFNTSTGYYEVYDCSTNGTFLHTGNRLQAGVYNSLQRGSILWIGSQSQQFQLM